MAAQDGRNFTLGISQGSPTEFALIGGFTTNSITLNEETVDITNKSSPNKFRELLRAGVKSVSISGSGIFTDGTAEATVRSSYYGTAIDEFQITVPDFFTFEGPFVVTSLSYEGPDNQAVTYSITLESAGDVTATAV